MSLAYQAQYAGLPAVTASRGDCLALLALLHQAEAKEAPERRPLAWTPESTMARVDRGETVRVYDVLLSLAVTIVHL